MNREQFQYERPYAVHLFAWQFTVSLPPGFTSTTKPVICAAIAEDQRVLSSPGANITANVIARLNWPGPGARNLFFSWLSLCKAGVLASPSGGQGVWAVAHTETKHRAKLNAAVRRKLLAVAAIYLSTPVIVRFQTVQPAVDWLESRSQ